VDWGCRKEITIFRDDAKAEETRREYVKYLTRLLTLSGVPEADAEKQAAAVMQLETALAGRRSTSQRAAIRRRSITR